MSGFDHFNLIAPRYEKAIPLRREQQLIELAGLPVEGALLDAGGGTGRVAQALLPYAGRVVIADPSAGMLRQAKAKERLELACTHAEKLPFPSDYFERILIVDALHHVICQEETAAELWRVLKPGGRLLIEEPDVRTLAVKLIAIAEKIALMRSRFLKPEAVAALFGQAGARKEVIAEGTTAWVIVEKLPTLG